MVNYITFYKSGGQILSVSPRRLFRDTEDVGVLAVQNLPKDFQAAQWRVSQNRLIRAPEAAESQARSRARNQSSAKLQLEESRRRFLHHLDRCNDPEAQEALRVLGNLVFGPT